jgi:mRNA-binding protein PUF3
MEHVLSDQQVELVKELEKDVMKLLNDQNGNHVLQKAVECVPAEHIQFIVDILVGQINIMAMHAYGCRIVQRMLERCEAPYRNIILQELHACGESLIPDQYGNYVAQHVITHGDLESRNKMTKLVLLNVSEYSKHKYASNVVEKCLVHGTDEQRREIMMRVLAKTDSRETGLYSYLKCGYGNYVIRQYLLPSCVSEEN